MSRRTKLKKKRRKKLPTFIKLYLLLYPLFLFSTLETLNATNIFDVCTRIFTPYTFLSCTAILLVILMIFSISDNIFLAGFLASIMLYIFYVVNFYRKEITGWVFVPQDFSFIKNLGNLASFTHLNYHKRIGLTFAIIFFLLSILFVISKRVHLKFAKRFKIFVTSLIIFWILFFTEFSKINILPLFSVDTRIKFTVNQIYEKYGVIMGFYVGYAQETKLKPPNYNQTTINKIAEEIQKYSRKKKKKITPNVIVIMSEAFADPTLWSNIKFSTEPIPNFKKLREQSIYGNIITPVFGGATCNVEYEFNTCNSLYFFKSETIPYEQINTYFTNEKMETVPKIFKQNGYETIGLHTYSKEFFNREKIYPLLGFDKFITAEDMKNAPIKGNYISDKYLTDKLIYILRTKKNPLFLYATTMENHYPFQPKKFAEPNPIKAQSNLLNTEQLESVNSYLHGINDADKQLKRITDYLQKYDEPTILIFFGDHLPILADSGFGLYVDLKYISSDDNLKWNTDDYYKIYTTPYLIWNNFDKKKINLGDISPYFLSNYLLNILGFEKPLRFQFMDMAYEKFHALKENLFIDSNGNKHSVPQDENITNMFWNLQYDSIWGEKYLK